MLKAIAQKGISWLPFPHRVNGLCQWYVTRGLRLTPAWIEDKLTHADRHIRHSRDFAGGIKGATVLEVGTGWYPAVPLFVWLCGAGSVVTADIRSHVSKDGFLNLMNELRSLARSGELERSLGAIDPNRLDQFLETDFHARTLAELLDFFSIELVVGDLTHTGLGEATCDLIVSNNTLEHIPPKVLAAVLAKCKLMLKSQGIMSHAIDLSDHFSHLDRSIGDLHFLRYSKRQWAWIDNRIQPQNRLRINEYRSFFREGGWRILAETVLSRNEAAVTLQPLHPDYQSMAPGDVCVTHASFVLAPG